MSHSGSSWTLSLTVRSLPGNAPAAIFVRARESKAFRYLVKSEAIRWVEARLVAYAVAPSQVAAMKLKDGLYTTGRTMAFRRLYLEKRK